MTVKTDKNNTGTWTTLPGLGVDSKFNKFKTWAPESGRALSGGSTGRVQYIKRKAACKFPVLTPAQYRFLKDLSYTEPQYFKIRVEEDTGEVHIFKAYTSDVDYSSELVCGSEKYYKDVTIDFIEQ
jgi:hypothetical protein